MDGIELSPFAAEEPRHSLALRRMGEQAEEKRRLSALAVGLAASRVDATKGGGMVAPGAAPALPSAAPLPLNWSSAVDSTTGRTYFANNATHETSWEAPEQAADPGCSEI